MPRKFRTFEDALKASIKIWENLPETLARKWHIAANLYGDLDSACPLCEYDQFASELRTHCTECEESNVWGYAKHCRTFGSPYMQWYLNPSQHHAETVLIALKTALANLTNKQEI